MATKKNISIAYSPDTDDQFMVLALKNGLVDWREYNFEFVVGDIQELNTAARKLQYDITAISVGAYPGLRDHYQMMPVGASVGDQFGPAVVIKPSLKYSIDTIAGKTVAVPGLNTSAYIAAQALFGPFKPVECYFLDIPELVLSGKVDAGVLIHELQMHPESKGLKKIGDLGLLWFNRWGLPLPLGANAIRRDLGKENIRNLTAIYKESIQTALHSRHSSIASAIKTAAAAPTLNSDLGDKYISMYVNQRSLDIQDDTRQGIRRLFDEGAKLGLFKPLNFDSMMIN